MKKCFQLTVLGIALTALGGCVTQPTQPPMTELSPTHFFDTASVIDDAMEASATITTERGWQVEPTFLFGRIHDVYLRAFIDKKSGLSVFQVYTWLRYPGDGWRHYTGVNYETTSGLQTTTITPIGSPQVDCSMRSVGCIYTEHMGFKVSEAQLRQTADTYKGKPIAPWRFRLKPRTGPNYDGEVSVAEIVGLLAKVDEYRLSKGLMKP